MNGTHKHNRLANETSPYLLQHAHNPVNWYPWCDEALDKAHNEQKPILLSIGYSACHWCHVMAHESFEDEATAQLMNTLCVNIKVDREERPDLDKIYQTAHQILTQRGGGWPLTVFLTPDDHMPFFAGTYFPSEPRHSMPAFREIIERVVNFYHENQADIKNQNKKLRTYLATITNPPADEQALNATTLDTARRQLEQGFDERLGGFGQAPKFPHPTNLERALRHYAGTVASGNPDQRALHIFEFTLDCMANGGLYDHLGGGFSRYSVDDQWMIPHFEKMLYDSGPLLALYAQGYAVTGKPRYKRVCNETAAWVMHEMQSPGGGYYSSIDADSEGEEGKFYAWDANEVKAHLNEDEFLVFAKRFGLDRRPNFEGRWHLHIFRETKNIAAELNMAADQIEALLNSTRAKLFELREQRVKPGRDDKILPSWNALMIRGMAIAARHLDQPDWYDSAARALNFIRTTLWQGQRLLATYKDDKAHLPAYLDDYAFLLDALLELLQYRWDYVHFIFATEVADVLVSHFLDKKNGGFWFTANDHEQLIQRPKPYADEAMPAGNGIAAFALQRLGHLTGDTRYLSAAEQTLKAASGVIKESPFLHNTLLAALEESLYPTQCIVLRGHGDELSRWQQRLITPYAPRRLALAIPGDETGLTGLMAERKRVQHQTTAYVCSGTHCQAPMNEYAVLDELLSGTEIAVPNT